MSAFIGRLKNKGTIRRNERNYKYFKDLIDDQNTTIFKEEELIEKFKEIAKEKYKIDD